MDPHERWQALQARIAAARLALEKGDSSRALDEVDQALKIDPQYLAAQALRERILAHRLDADVAARAASASSASLDQFPTEAGPAAVESGATDNPGAASTAPVPPPAAPRPLVSPEGFARFEERARRRRVDRRLEAARLALAERRTREAAAALEEVAELDSNLPELVPLVLELDRLRRASSHANRGPWLAAAAVFGVMILGASWLEESRVRFSTPALPAVAERASEEKTPASAAVPDAPSAAEPRPADAAPVAAIPEPAPPVEARVQRDASPAPAATAGAAASSETRPVRPERAAAEVVNAVGTTPPPAPAASPVAAAPSRPVPSAVPARLETPVLPPEGDPAAVLPQASITPPPAESRAAAVPVRPVSEPAPAAAAPPAAASPSLAPRPVPTPPAIDDEALIKQALQRYRMAYDGLDASSARAIWPAVDQAALARAFDGLESQHLTFESCNVQLGAGKAAATCRGSAEYIPKVGSREPRTEPRVWTFALRRNGAAWIIDSARAER
ncbi:MAG TPA: hypothetical protein VL309_05380 [Vicinamibacterales bacterium]|nr:hypothetical protein [Vicinamibacterales bacterium]